MEPTLASWAELPDLRARPWGVLWPVLRKLPPMEDPPTESASVAGSESWLLLGIGSCTRTHHVSSRQLA